MKYHIIYSHRRDYPVSVMCSFFGVSRSGYYYENLLDRNFQADKPNAKWVTDFRISITSEGILYLSMIRDLYDNSIVAYKTPLCLKLNIFLPRVFFVLSAQSGAAQLRRTFFFLNFF